MEILDLYGISLELYKINNLMRKTMNTKELVTVVVTLYNKEDYIEHCLKSIQNQSYENLEVIVINDGSTDNSLSKARRIEKNDSRFRVIDNENGGVSSARNYGIKLAHGQKMIFIDGDDYVDKDYVSNLMKYSNCDLVISGFYEVVNDQKIKKSISQDALLKADKFREYIFNGNHYSYFVIVWNKLFQTNIIKDNNLSYENIVMGEDADFVFKYLAHCQKIKIISQADYYNVIVPNTLSRKKTTKLWQHNLEVIESAIKYLYPTEKEQNFLIMHSVKITLGGNCDNYSDFRSVLKEIIKSSEFKKVNLNNITEKKDAMIYIAIKLRQIKLLQKMFQIRIGMH